jgi:hypothetical protein
MFASFINSDYIFMYYFPIVTIMWAHIGGKTKIGNKVTLKANIITGVIQR